MIDSRKTTYPLAKMKQHMTEIDMVAKKTIPPKPLYRDTDQTHIGYYQIYHNHRPGIDRLNIFWNLGTGSWNANIRYPSDQTNWVAECITIIKSVRLADPDTAPPTPMRPTRDGVEDPDFPEEIMIEWRKHHE